MVHVTNAQDMFDAITSRLDDQNYIIMAAAVADYRPEMVADQKKECYTKYYRERSCV